MAIWYEVEHTEEGIRIFLDLNRCDKVFGVSHQ